MKRLEATESHATLLFVNILLLYAKEKKESTISFNNGNAFLVTSLSFASLKLLLP